MSIERFSNKNKTESTLSEFNKGLLVLEIVALEKSGKKMPIDITNVFLKHTNSISLECLNRSLSLCSCGNIKIIAVNNNTRYFLVRERPY
jgi:hypothetical protein